MKTFKTLTRFTAIGLLFCSLAAFNTSYAGRRHANGRRIPEPYKSLKKVLPFNGQGWFMGSNAAGLTRLIKQHKVKTVIEVGSWLGSSTRFIAKQLPVKGKVYAVDHWLGSSEHQTSSVSDYLPTLYEQFLSNVIHEKLTHKIIPVRMPSLEAAETLTHIKPDLIYIDASHETEFVLADLRAWYPYVAETGGILCGDDWSWKSVRKAVEIFAQEKNLEIRGKGNFWEYLPKK